MDTPEIRYARSENVHIAYQVLGRGPVDLVLGLPWVTHLGVEWEDAPNAQFFRDLASFSRLVLFDKRGVGLSDRDVGVPTLEERMDDFRAVMDGVGSKKAVLLGISESAAMSLLFAAAHPERTLGLILIGGTARTLHAPDYPWGSTREAEEDFVRRVERDWGTAALINWLTADLAPSRANDAEFKRWLSRELSYGASPSSAAALTKMYSSIDVRSVLPAIHVPTLVLSADNGSDIQHAKYIAANVSGAKFVELPGHEHLYFGNPEATDAVLRSVRDFLKDLPESSETERVLTTVLFTDIVSSTDRASRLGDNAWGRILDQYHANARSAVARFRGRLIKTIGDGLLAIFDGPTRAVRCACTLRDQARESGLEIRAGLHAGECILKEGDVQGVAVHIAARVCEGAGEGEVLVSRTVRDLSVGSEIRFDDRGTRLFKGLEGEWNTYSVVKS